MTAEDGSKTVMRSEVIVNALSCNIFALYFLAFLQFFTLGTVDFFSVCMFWTMKIKINGSVLPCESYALAQ